MRRERERERERERKQRAIYNHVGDPEKISDGPAFCKDCTTAHPTDLVGELWDV